MTPQDRMTIEEVSKILGISINTLQRKSWRKKMGIPLEKIGKDLISFHPLLDKWIDSKWLKS